MQSLDKNSLFSIFEKGDEEVYAEHGVEGQLNNPFVLMGMVVRGLENYEVMDIMYMRRHPESYKNVRELTKYKYYSKLYGYLKRIDVLDSDNIYKVGGSFGRDQCFLSLDNMLRFFEKHERYERCGVIKRYQDLLLDSYVDGRELDLILSKSVRSKDA
jgi:hypothetical protein